MKLNKWMKLIIVGAGVLALASCSSGRKVQYSQNGEAGADAYVNDAASSGVGEQTTFGDASGGQGQKNLAAGRVYYFDFDSNIVHDSDKPAITRNAQTIASKTDTQAILEGHTDPRGSREYNIGLGERRAKSVAKIMTKEGVNPKQIRVVSYGAEKPAAPGHTEADYQLNRRAVLVYSQR